MTPHGLGDMMLSVKEKIQRSFFLQEIKHCTNLLQIKLRLFVGAKMVGLLAQLDKSVLKRLYWYQNNMGYLAACHTEKEMP
jgi:hypothetical protein